MLDDAPFHIVVPNSDWQIKETKDQPTGNHAFIAASVVNTNTRLGSIVIKYVLANTSGSSLNDLCAGIREGLTNQSVNQLSETETTFLGYKARIITFQQIKDNLTLYHEMTVFFANGYFWSIGCIGPSERKDEIKKIISFYQKNSA